MRRLIGIQEVAASILSPATLCFLEIWSWSNFYGHSLPIADSRSAAAVTGETQSMAT